MFNMSIQLSTSQSLSKGKKQRAEVKVVVAKGAHKGLKGRPKGVKGRYVMVDSRMRKEVGLSSVLRRSHFYLQSAKVRAQKRREKARKSR